MSFFYSSSLLESVGFTLHLWKSFAKIRSMNISPGRFWFHIRDQTHRFVVGTLKLLIKKYDIKMLTRAGEHKQFLKQVKETASNGYLSTYMP